MELGLQMETIGSAHGKPIVSVLINPKLVPATNGPESYDIIAALIIIQVRLLGTSPSVALTKRIQA